MREPGGYFNNYFGHSDVAVMILGSDFTARHCERSEAIKVECVVFRGLPACRQAGFVSAYGGSSQRQLDITNDTLVTNEVVTCR